MNLRTGGLTPEVLPALDVIFEVVWVAPSVLGDVLTNRIFEVNTVCFLERD